MDEGVGVRERAVSTAHAIGPVRRCWTARQQSTENRALAHEGRLSGRQRKSEETPLNVGKVPEGDIRDARHIRPQPGGYEAWQASVTLAYSTLHELGHALYGQAHKILTQAHPVTGRPGSRGSPTG